MSAATLDLIAQKVRINPIVIVIGSGDTARSLRYRGKHTVHAVLGFLRSQRESRALVYSHRINGEMLWIDVQTGAFCNLH
ncbi:MAG: hypothetical protein RXR20_05720 [Paraburkholderia sp.]|jgi:hypothetical protein|uniref:hypothetical protein n=1 Tax=Burkholderiaceae TaxID=119060 RepID=UPI0010F93BFF|nr:hypothetical protein [Burkholderia sp. 4M9327F10]